MFVQLQKKHLATLCIFAGILLVLSVYIGYHFFFYSKVTKVLVYPRQETINTEKDIDLVFFFHGANCDESYIFRSFDQGGLELKNPSRRYRKDIIFYSFGYDSPIHWSGPDITKDSIKEIKKIIKKYKVRKIILIGVSMGGSTALNILSNADKGLQKLISDVVAVFPIIDYGYTLANTKRENIRDFLSRHFMKFKNPKEIMKQSSPISYVSFVPANTRIILAA